MKRSRIPDVFKNRKKFRVAASESDHLLDESNVALSEVPSDTKAALLYLRSLVNVKAFEDRIPPIVFKQQVYSIVSCKTVVDKQINDLREKKEIKLFRLGKESDAFAIVFTDNYRDHIRKTLADSPAKERFLETVIEKSSDVSLDQKTMTDFGFKDEEITQLLHGGVLNVRDVGSWWIAIPGAGIFMKCFTKGRDSVLRTIRKSKYQKILQKELEERKLVAVKKLGIQYHIHDIIGAELVTKQDTTSGPMLTLDV
ncbi:serine/threonine-protein kinase 19-like [Asterias rubens]|uniref:serine/threonine-protein kinase 19-like n=1 Tax=Asterias rubens TaxID=7604 RepID=UPI001455AEFF|nr:serine/threonine-protein kinase 19-like [Asterias rubens]XP_033630886.1 serine/threonine-protein kinase 19-like [Asterias rubens]XP_033630887.1 serine/threonine-protein kinase 19-like [Asterias rubens]